MELDEIAIKTQPGLGTGFERRENSIFR